MCNDAYIDDGENELMEYAHNGPDNQDQEEANFYFALHEFKEIVARHGIKKVIREMDDYTEAALWHYYSFEDYAVPEELPEFEPYNDNIKYQDDEELPF